MTTQQHHGPPAGDLATVPVHIASVEAGVELGPVQRPVRRIRTMVKTILIQTGDTDIYPLRQKHDKRVRSVIVVHTAPNTGAQAGAFGWISENKADAGRQQGGFIGCAATINIPVVLVGTTELWVAIDPAATMALGITVYDEIDLD